MSRIIAVATLGIPLRRPCLVALLICGLWLGMPVAKAEDPKKKGPAPKGFVLDKSEHDFGIVEQNNEYDATVGYRNTGSRPITNIRVKADCGCYAAAVSGDTLAPGASGEISIQFRTLSFRGVVVKTLSILYDDGGPKRAALKLKVKVFGGVLVVPGRVYFGEILEGTKPEAAVDLMYYPEAGEPFTIEKIDLGDLPIKATITPYNDPKFKERKGWHVSFRFTQPPKRGVYSKRATLHLSHPRRPKVHVPLTAHVVGKVWMQTSRIHLGLVAQGESKNATVMLRHFDGTTSLGAVSAKARKGILQVSIEDTFTPPGPGTPPRKAKLIRVTVPKDAPVGSLNDDIVVTTEVPGEEEVVIQVRGRIYERLGG